MRRLGSGERWWTAQIVVRAMGLAALGLCAVAASWLCRAMQAPQHQANLIDTGTAALAFLSWAVGAAFAVEGPGLFRLMAIPGRPLMSGDM